MAIANTDYLEPSLEHSVVNNDRELNGEINKSTTQGAKFALLMAMLEQNHLHRPSFETTKEPENPTLEKLPLHYYRASALSATEQTWLTLNQTSQLVSSGYKQSALLWLAMHPEPLSQFDNNTQLPVEVSVNCSLPTQERIKSAQDKCVAVDETGLYDILKNLAH